MGKRGPSPNLTTSSKRKKITLKPGTSFPRHKYAWFDKNFSYRNRLLREEMAFLSGCRFISQTTVKLYRETKSLMAVAKALQLNPMSVRNELIAIGEPIRPATSTKRKTR